MSINSDSLTLAAQIQGQLLVANQALDKLKNHQTTSAFNGIEQALYDSLAALAQAIALQQQFQLAFASATIAKLELKKGDTLIVQLGDSNTGWIPGPDQEKRMEELLAKLALPVPALVYHYAAKFTVATVPAATPSA